MHSWKKILLSLFLLLNRHYSLAVVEQDARRMAELNHISVMAKIVMRDAYARFIRKQMQKYPPFFQMCCGMLLGGLIGHTQKRLAAKYHEIKYDSEFKNAGYTKPLVLIKRTFPFFEQKKLAFFKCQFL